MQRIWLFLTLLLALFLWHLLLSPEVWGASVSPPAELKTPAQLEAEAFRVQVEEAQADLSEKLKATFSDLEESLREIEPLAKNLRAEGRVLNHLRTLVRELRLHGTEVLKSQKEFVGSASTFAERLSEGPSHFRTVAAEFRSFAEEETFSELAVDYRHVASSFEELALRCESQLRRVTPAIEDYRANLAYIERSVVFLIRFDQALATVPDLAEFERLEGSLTELSRYVKGFERLRGSLRAFDERLRAPGGTPAARQGSSPSLPTRKRWDYRLARNRK